MRAMHKFCSLSMDSSVVDRGGSAILRSSLKLQTRAKLHNSQSTTQELHFDASKGVDTAFRPSRPLVRPVSVPSSTFPSAPRNPHGESHVRHEDRCSSFGFNPKSSSFC